MSILSAALRGINIRQRYVGRDENIRHADRLSDVDAYSDKLHKTYPITPIRSSSVSRSFL